MVPNMNCGVCKSKRSNYKCPNCRLQYCSLNCWKEHKKLKCETSPPEEPVQNGCSVKRKYDYVTEDTVPLERLNMLGESKTLLQILQNPELRDMLVSIDKSDNPESAMKLAMQNPLFVQFSDECLKIVEPVENGSTQQESIKDE